MKAFILAAGLGTRLRPWTLSHPKALVPVGGIPMLERVICNLRQRGFDEIVVNVHHFASQIVDFLNQNECGRGVNISDESGLLLDTGGGILHAEQFLAADERPFLVHNVDILSDADLGAVVDAAKDADVALLVSDRESSRRLVFGPDLGLRGWHSLKDGKFKPEDFRPEEGDVEYAFSGIHAMKPTVFDEMRRLGYRDAFPVMDFYLNPANRLSIRATPASSLHLLDIGKPETLSRANHLFE